MKDRPACVTFRIVVSIPRSSGVDKATAEVKLAEKIIDMR